MAALPGSFQNLAVCPVVPDGFPLDFGKECRDGNGNIGQHKEREGKEQQEGLELVAMDLFPLSDQGKKAHAKQNEVAEMIKLNKQRNSVHEKKPYTTRLAISSAVVERICAMVSRKAGMIFIVISKQAQCSFSDPLQSPLP